MPENSLENLIDCATSKLKSLSGGSPTMIVAAPGRVNLIGDHVDYNDGIVVPMAIDCEIVIAAIETDGDASTVSFHSLDLDQQYTWDMSRPTDSPDAQWHTYVKGVISLFARLGYKIPGFKAVIASSIPVGSGLSSSAALEVATATLIETICGPRLSSKEKALLCQQAEHEFAGVPCGIMDQFSSVFGKSDHLMLLDCRSHEIEHIPFADAGVTILISNSRKSHELNQGEYATRRRECAEAAKQMRLTSLRDATPDTLKDASGLEATVIRRARHVITETDRARRFSDAIRARAWQQAGQQMYESHDSLRNDFEVSCSELDLLVDIAKSIGISDGVYGSRMTGGGFGGCTVSLVKSDRVDYVAEHIIRAYRRSTGITPQIFSSRPADGARVILPAVTR